MSSLEDERKKKHGAIHVNETMLRKGRQQALYISVTEKNLRIVLKIILFPVSIFLSVTNSLYKICTRHWNNNTLYFDAFLYHRCNSMFYSKRYNNMYTGVNYWFLG